MNSTCLLLKRRNDEESSLRTRCFKYVERAIINSKFRHLSRVTLSKIKILHSVILPKTYFSNEYLSSLSQYHHKTLHSLYSRFSATSYPRIKHLVHLRFYSLNLEEPLTLKFFPFFQHLNSVKIISRPNCNLSQSHLLASFNRLLRNPKIPLAQVEVTGTYNPTSVNLLSLLNSQPPKHTKTLQVNLSLEDKNTWGNALTFTNLPALLRYVSLHLNSSSKLFDNLLISSPLHTRLKTLAIEITTRHDSDWSHLNKLQLFTSLENFSFSTIMVELSHQNFQKFLSNFSLPISLKNINFSLGFATWKGFYNPNKTWEQNLSEHEELYSFFEQWNKFETLHSLDLFIPTTNTPAKGDFACAMMSRLLKSFKSVKILGINLESNDDEELNTDLETLNENNILCLNKLLKEISHLSKEIKRADIHFPFMSLKGLLMSNLPQFCIEQLWLTGTLLNLDEIDMIKVLLAKPGKFTLKDIYLTDLDKHDEFLSAGCMIPRQYEGFVNIVVSSEIDTEALVGDLIEFLKREKRPKTGLSLSYETGSSKLEVLGELGKALLKYPVFDNVEIKSLTHTFYYVRDSNSYEIVKEDDEEDDFDEMLELEGNMN